MCQKQDDHARKIRKDWGCDKDAPNELDRIPCHCDGSPACSRCAGQGYTSLHRCPNAVIKKSTHEAIRYAALAKQGLWPAPGGALDQTQSFLDAYGIITSEISRIEEESHGST